MSTSSHELRERVRPNRVAVACVAAAGVALGATPYLLSTQSGYLALPLFAYAALVIAWKARIDGCQATQHPEALEWLLAGWAAVGVGAVAGAIGFAWYWGVYGIAWVAAAAVRALGWGLDIDPAEIGNAFSITFFAIFAAALPFVLADELPVKLYPRVAGTRSAYFALANRRGLVAAFAAAGVAVAAGLVLLGVDLHGFWFTLLATVALMLTGTPLLGAGEVAPTRPEAAQAIEAVKKLFTAAGYAITEKPSTGDPETDPLIAVIDLLARAPSRAYAVKLTMLAGTEAQAQSASAVELRTAARMLQRLLRAADAPESIVEPYLLVVGGTLGKELQVLAIEEGVRLAHFADADALRAALAPEASPAEQQARALDVLRITPAGPTAAADSTGAGATT